MARVIIGIHGLGNKPDPETLHAWWERSMIEGLNKNGYSAKLPKFEMVYWADINYKSPMDKNIDDPHNPLFLDEKYTTSPPGFEAQDYPIRKKVVKYIGKLLYRIFLNEDLTLNYAFIPSYFIRKYFRELDVYFLDDCEAVDPHTCKVKERIKQRLLETLEKYKDDEILLVSHSMGSIVAFDVLSFMAKGLRVNTFVTIGSPLGMPMIISKVANQYKQNPRGKREMITPPCICNKWINLYDILDKITFSYSLGKRYKPNDYNIKPIDSEVINDYHNAKGEHNPHKSYGYLRTKEFASLLNDFIGG
jgi:hypothetical protein